MNIEHPLASFLQRSSAIPCDSLRQPVSNSRHFDADTFTILASSFFEWLIKIVVVVLIVISTHSSHFPRTISDWNKLSQDVRSKPSIVSFRSALLQIPGPRKNKRGKHKRRWTLERQPHRKCKVISEFCPNFVYLNF